MGSETSYHRVQNNLKIEILNHWNACPSSRIQNTRRSCGTLYDYPRPIIQYHRPHLVQYMDFIVLRQIRLTLRQKLIIKNGQFWCVVDYFSTRRHAIKMQRNRLMIPTRYGLRKQFRAYVLRTCQYVACCFKKRPTHVLNTWCVGYFDVRVMRSGFIQVLAFKNGKNTFKFAIFQMGVFANLNSKG